MPRLWSESLEGHRQAVHEAILTTTAALVAEQGLRSVTMSQIAEGAGIGRATLYKYFPDVESILHVWHEREMHRHLGQLVELGNSSGSPTERLEAVLRAYPALRYGHHSPDLGEVLRHGKPHVDHAEQRLHGFLRDLLSEAVAAGELRDDLSADELTDYCISSLAAAAGRPEAAVGRLVTVVLDGMRRRPC